MNGNFRHALLVAAVVAISNSARSAAVVPTQQQIDWCVKKDRTYSPEQQIEGCTAAINSGWWSGKGITWALSDRCDAYIRNHKPDLALEDCNEAIRLDPANADAYTNRCLAHSKKGEPDLALADCNEAIRLRPDDAVAYNNRGIAYQTKGEFDNAIADYYKAQRVVARRYPEADNNRGTAYEAKGDFNDAIADYSTAILFKPNFARAYSNRCRALAVVGKDLENALKDCDASLRLRPKDTKSLNIRGLVNLKLGSFAQAITDYDAAIAQSATDANSLYGRGIAKLKSGNAAGGNADIAAAKSIQPDIDKVYASYGVN